MEGLLAVCAALVLATAVALWLRRAPRRLTSPASAPTEVVLGPADLGSPLGERATLVAFSSAFCQPCRATRQVLEQVSSQVPGVSHVEIDAESHLDLVRRLKVLRTPTVLVLDGSGRVVRRATGAPRKPDVVAALGEFL